MKKSFHGKLWCFGSVTLVETLAFRAVAFNALVFVPGEAATDHPSAAKSWRNNKQQGIYTSSGM
jgi:hypothetical protein